MAVKNIVLAFLGIEPATGYDLKKWFTESPSFSWIESSQVYRILNCLEKDGLAKSEIQYGDPLHKKIYSITEKGIKHVGCWFDEEPVLPEVKNFVHQKLVLAARQNNKDLVLHLLSEYKELVSRELTREAKKLKRGHEIFESQTSSGHINAPNADDDIGYVSDYPAPANRIEIIVPEMASQYYGMILATELQWLDEMHRRLGILA